MLGFDDEDAAELRSLGADLSAAAVSADEIGSFVGCRGTGDDDLVAGCEIEPIGVESLLQPTLGGAPWMLEVDDDVAWGDVCLHDHGGFDRDAVIGSGVEEDAHDFGADDLTADGIHMLLHGDHEPIDAEPHAAHDGWESPSHLPDHDC